MKWINGSSNPADSMTKEKALGALKRLLDTNKVELEALKWVERVSAKREDGDSRTHGDDKH